MSSTVTVRKVETPADFRAFFEFPWRLYQGDPNWVPPLLSMRRDLLDRRKNPSWAYLEGDHFTAWRGDQIVGTISAFINHRHNEFHDEHIGWFGTFEVRDDQEAASALLNTAADWVRARGYQAIRGPQSFTTHEECGLLVDGFIRPVILMPYNPPYYKALVENAGFQKVMDVHSFYLNRDEALQPGGMWERTARVGEALMKRNKITIRPVDRKNLKADFALFKELYNQAWEKNWGFTPMTDRELDGLVESLGQFFEPRLAMFAYVNGDPAGFLLPVPDFNQVLQKVYPRPGVPEIFSLLKALYYWKINPCINWVRSPLMGVREEYRRKGVHAVMLYHGLKIILNDSPFVHSDSGWILEVNHDLVRLLHDVGATIYKTHRFYERVLA